MIWCESCREPIEDGLWEETWTHNGEERNLVICDACFNGTETRDHIWDRVQLRRWNQTKSERQYHADDERTAG